MADVADRYALYQEAVQNPTADIALIERVFKERYGRNPRTLREDFCGTAWLCCAWADSTSARRAIGVDIDPGPLAWGARHNLAPLPEETRGRVELVTSDVRHYDGPAVDVIVAGNFSFCALGSREELLAYFRAAYAKLAPEGLLLLDVVGGPETQREKYESVRSELAFDYVWEQRSFDPITYRAEFAISFRFPDGTALEPAFEYEWRLWTLPELRDLLREAGFSEIDVYWELTGADGRGSGKFRRVQRAPASEGWLCEVVAFP